MKIKPKNWDKFQHYKDRNPPWIKLHKDLLDDYDWWCLPVASRALAPCLWIYASCFDDGIFDASHEKLAFRFRMKVKDVEEAIKPLINKGYFIVDSNSLAECKQHAMPETETETETETEVENNFCAKDDGFDEFWNFYPKRKKKNKLAAIKAWKIKKPPIQDVITALTWQKESFDWDKNNGQYIPLPASYINAGAWQDERHDEGNPF